MVQSEMTNYSQNSHTLNGTMYTVQDIDFSSSSDGSEIAPRGTTNVSKSQVESRILADTVYASHLYDTNDDEVQLFQKPSNGLMQGFSSVQQAQQQGATGDEKYLEMQKAQISQKKMKRIQSSVVTNTSSPRTLRDSPSMPAYTVQAFNDNENNKVEQGPSKGTPRAFLQSTQQQKPNTDNMMEKKLSIFGIQTLNDPSSEEDEEIMELPKAKPAKKSSSEIQQQEEKDTDAGEQRDTQNSNEAVVVVDSSKSYKAVTKVAQVDTRDVRAFMMAPAPKSGSVQCFIKRDRSYSKLYPRYLLYLDGQNKFLASAKKRRGSKSSNYIISLDHTDHDREGENFLGKLRANFIGTEFMIYDSGEKFSRVAKLKRQTATRKELGFVLYDYNVLGTRGPRKMFAAIPKIQANGQYKLFQTRDTGDKGMVDLYRDGFRLSDIITLKNKQPRWNQQLNAFCLNFSGRVTQASVKNFQLIDESDSDYIYLQFGKIGKDDFTMDFQHPMSALQAFSICLSSIDNKLACE